MLNLRKLYRGYPPNISILIWAEIWYAVLKNETINKTAQ